MLNSYFKHPFTLNKFHTGLTGPYLAEQLGDRRKVSLWLGHADLQTTEMYLRAGPTEKLEAIDAITPPSLKRGRLQVPDKLIASLQQH